LRSGGHAYGSGRAEPGFHLIVTYESSLLTDQLSIAEDKKIRNAAHVITGGELRVFIGVNFEDDGLSGEISGGTGHFGRSHAAGTTPVRPEINQNGDAGVLEDVIEELGISSERLADGGQRVLAGATAACIG